MRSKKYYCDICEKYISNKSSHNKLKLHKHLSLSDVNKNYIPNVSVIEIDNIINKHIYDYNKNFYGFTCWYNIQNDRFSEKNKIIWPSLPRANKIMENVIKRYNCRENDLIDIEIVFVTDLESATYSHYLQLPRSMLERKICQIIDRNPNLIKRLDKMPRPYKRHIINKHWGFQHQTQFGIRLYYPVNWMDLEPKWL